MAVKELPDSPRQVIARDLTESAVEREFWVTDVATSGQASDAARAFAGETVVSGGRNLVLDRVQVAAVESADDDVWRVTCIYDAEIVTGDVTGGFSFDTGGGTYNIKLSRRTAYASEPLSGSQAAHSGLINADSQGNVHGVDIVVPNGAFTINRHFKEGDLGADYGITVLQLTGSVNIEPFKGGAPGEILFMGAAGTQDASGDWDINYNFFYLPNEVFLVPIGWDDAKKAPVRVESVLKHGHDYMWTIPGKHEDKGALVPHVERVFVEEVYARKDLSQLKIGT